MNTFFFFKMPRVAWVFLLLLAFLTTTNAQEVGIITKLNITDRSLSMAQGSQYQKLTQSGGYVSSETQFVQINSLAQMAQTGRLSLSLTGKEVVFEGEDIKYNSEQDYTWYGKSTTGDDLLLISQDGFKIGSASIGGEQFELLDLGGNVAAWMRINKAAFAPSECGVSGSTPSGTDDIVGDIANTTCETRVLVLYTPAAAAATPDMNARIALAISQTNQGLANSQVPATSCKLVLAHKQQLSFNETGSMSTDVNTLANNATAQALRNQHYADIVVLLTNGTNYGGTLGIVKAIGPSNADAYTIVQTNAATSAYYTFAHEVGHLFGCRHNNDPNGPYEHGHNFNAEGLRKTILNVLYDPQGGTRILHYSNPSVKFMGVPTGTTQRDNARKLKETGCTVASFRGNPGPPPFAAYIIGSPWGCACSNKNLTSSITGGTAPYQYEWSISFNGTIWTEPMGNAPNFSLPMPCNTNQPFIWVKLKVTSATGQVTQTTKKFIIVEC